MNTGQWSSWGCAKLLQDPNSKISLFEVAYSQKSDLTILTTVEETIRFLEDSNHLYRGVKPWGKKSVLFCTRSHTLNFAPAVKSDLPIQYTYSITPPLSLSLNL